MDKTKTNGAQQPWTSSLDEIIRSWDESDNVKPDLHKPAV